MSELSKLIKLFLSSSWMWLVGGKGKLGNLRNDTAVVIDNALSAEICRELIAIIEDILAVNNHPRVWRDNLESDSRILGFEKDVGPLLKYFEIEDKIRNVDQYTGRKTRSWFLMANKVVPKDGNYGSGGGLHRDSPISHQVKFIWYLSDVGSDNGPFSFLPKSNTNVFESRKKYPIGQSRFNGVEDTLVDVCAGQGALLVCDTRCIHGGKPITHGVRYAVTLYTSPNPRDKERRVVKLDD